MHMILGNLRMNIITQSRSLFDESLQCRTSVATATCAGLSYQLCTNIRRQRYTSGGSCSLISVARSLLRLSCLRIVRILICGAPRM